MEDKSKPSIDEKKMQEFKDGMTNYNNWRWNSVSLYQSIFIIFITSVILILVDLIADKDILLKIIILFILIILSFFLYRKMLQQTQKPIFVCENVIGTIEHGPVNVKAEDGKEHSIFNLSGMHHKEIKK